MDELEIDRKYRTKWREGGGVIATPRVNLQLSIKKIRKNLIDALEKNLILVTVLYRLTPRKKNNPDPLISALKVNKRANFGTGKKKFLLT